MGQSEAVEVTEIPKFKWEWNPNTVLTLLAICGIVVGLLRWTSGIENANVLTNNKFDNAIATIQSYISRHESETATRREDSERRWGQQGERSSILQRDLDANEAEDKRRDDRIVAQQEQAKAILDRMDRQLDVIQSMRDDLSVVKTEQEVLKSIVIQQGVANMGNGPAPGVPPKN